MSTEEDPVRLNGRLAARWARRTVERLRRERNDINALNVFPVPDGETEDSWLIDGDVHLDELRRAIGRDLPQPDVETVAGLLIAERGALPTEGERVTIPLPIDPAELVDRDPTRWLLEVEVLLVERHVPTRLRLRLVESPMTEDDA